MGRLRLCLWVSLSLSPAAAGFLEVDGSAGSADDSEESVSSPQHLEAQDSTNTPEAEVEDSPSGGSGVVEGLSASQVWSNFSSTDKENETPSPSKKEWECSD